MQRYWRILATGLSFSVFMIGGLFLTAVPFQIIRLFSGTAAVRERRILGLIHRSFRFFMWFMVSVGVMKRPVWVDRDKFESEEACLYVANHPTLIDVVAIMSALPQINCIVKQSLWHHFFLGGIIRAAGFIPNSSGPELIDQCAKSFAAGKSLIVFPEGTRSPENGLRRFNRGAAQIAVRLGVPIFPIVISCNPPTLMKHQRWYEVPYRRCQLRLQFEPQLKIPDELKNIDEMPARVRCLNRCLHAHFIGALSREEGDRRQKPDAQAGGGFDATVSPSTSSK